MWNIKKPSFLSRGNQEAAYEPPEESGVLAVWGSPSSGKSITAVKIAKLLADKGKRVALLFADMTTPMLPCICGSSELDQVKSLGSILAATTVTATLIEHNCITHKKISNLMLFGLLKGENEYTYPPYGAEQASQLLQEIQQIAPYVVIDCSSNIANDVFSAVALMESDAVLRLANCTLKSISYLSSQLPLLKANRWNEEKQYRVASNVKPHEASEQAEQLFGNVSFTLPYSKELEEQALEGELFRDLAMKDSKGFRNGIAAIAKEVYGC